ncbi:MAG: hypothetical protein RDV41_09625, partial [Planctomycetota bacterium]|nr:hypothetical protein [Planctomycetota bacterium]
MAVLLAAASPAAAQDQPGMEIVSSRLEVDGPVWNVLNGDMDGDGRKDLVVFYRCAAEPGDEKSEATNGARTGAACASKAAVFRSEGGGRFSKGPLCVFALPPDAIAYSLADYGADPGDELLVLYKSGAGLMLAGSAQGQTEVRRVAEVDLFFPRWGGAGSEPFAWLWPEDIDGDGDGLSPCAGDCDDTDPTILPGATE